VVAWWQLVELGFTQRMIEGRVATERLFRVRRGIYALMPAVLLRGQIMAAALAYGPAAVLSHRAAAAVRDLGPWPSGTVDVTVAVRRRAQPGIRVHCAQVERQVADGFPVTTATRTLIDLASVLPLARLEEAFERAERLGVLDAESVREQMWGRRGAKKIRAVLAGLDATEPTRSELERAFRKLCKRHRLPLPSHNVSVHCEDVDAYWAIGGGVVVELDSWEWHRTRRAFERDREKAAKLERRGVRVLRFTWRQVERGGADVAATVRAALREAHVSHAYGG
jgi:hypothetical protein